MNLALFPAALLGGLQETLLRLSIMIGTVALVLSGVLAAALTKKIDQLLTAIRQVREGAYSHRAQIRGRDEIAQIGQEFNSLADRLQTTEDAGGLSPMRPTSSKRPWRPSVC